jgi:hypothetical protein
MQAAYVALTTQLVKLIFFLILLRAVCSTAAAAKGNKLAHLASITLNELLILVNWCLLTYPMWNVVPGTGHIASRGISANGGGEASCCQCSIFLRCFGHLNPKMQGIEIMLTLHHSKMQKSSLDHGQGHFRLQLPKLVAVERTVDGAILFVKAEPALHYLTPSVCKILQHLCSILVSGIWDTRYANKKGRSHWIEIDLQLDRWYAQDR